VDMEASLILRPDALPRSRARLGSRHSPAAGAFGGPRLRPPPRPAETLPATPPPTGKTVTITIREVGRPVAVRRPGGRSPKAASWKSSDETNPLQVRPGHFLPGPARLTLPEKRKRGPGELLHARDNICLGRSPEKMAGRARAKGCRRSNPAEAGAPGWDHPGRPRAESRRPSLVQRPSEPGGSFSQEVTAKGRPAALVHGKRSNPWVRGTVKVLAPKPVGVSFLKETGLVCRFHTSA